jgi:hypothetical protein
VRDRAPDVPLAIDDLWEVSDAPRDSLACSKCSRSYGDVKSGSDFTTLWTTPHPSGMSTTIHEAAIRNGADLFAERSSVSFPAESVSEIMF